MRRLQTRLLLIILAAMAPALAFQVYTEIQDHRIRCQLMEDEAMRFMGLVRSEQQRIVEGAEEVLGALASAPAVQDDVPDLCNRMLSNLVGETPRYTMAAVLGLDGRERCASTPIDPAANASDRLYFRRALATGGFVVGDYAVGRTNGRPSLHVAKPFTDRNGVVQGVVEVGLGLDWLEHQLATLSLPLGSATLIADRNGVVLVRHPDGALFQGKPVPAASRFLLEGTEARVVPLHSFDRRNLIAAVSPPGAGPDGLLIMVGLDRTISFADVAQSNWHGYAVIFTGAALGLATTAVLGARLIGRPVHRLLALAEHRQAEHRPAEHLREEHWRDGTLAARTGLRDDGSEFGRLGVAFESMASALAAREEASGEAEAALRRLTEELESRVRDEVAARLTAQARAVQSERVQVLGNLAGGIAHDFNNVLQTVVGAATLIEGRAEDPGAVRRLVRLVSESAARGASITRRLLAFGRRGDLRPERLDAAALLPGLQEIFAQTLGHDVEVCLRVDNRLPPILADKTQLEAALVNIASNAREAMPSGGLLHLSACADIVAAGNAVTPSLPRGLTPGRYARITIADSGIGMDPATVARAAEPFFTSKGSGGGIGLGLPMAKAFAEQSGGALAIESRPSHGTTVTMWLPLAAVEAAEPAMGVPECGRAKSAARVLLVDDEDLVREVLAEHLEEAGYHLLVAANGAEALALFASGEEVDAIVTDFSMPNMSGIALIRALQERRPGLPAVLLTGYAGEDADLIAAENAASSLTLLHKPIQRSVLVERIESLVTARSNAGRMGSA